MSFCHNCGAQLNDGEIFCRNCGAKQNPQTSQVSTQVLPPQQPMINVQGYSKPRKKINVPIISAIIVLILILGGLGYYFGNNYYIKSSPVRWISASVSKTAGAKTIDATSDIKVTMPSNGDASTNEQMAQLLSNMVIRTNIKSDKTKKEAFMTMSVLYKGQSIVDAKIYEDSKGLIVSIPALYEKSFYIGFDELNKLNSSDTSSTPNIDMNAYKPLFDVSGDKNFKALKKDYTNFISSKLNANFTKGGKADISIVKPNGQKSSIKCDQLGFTIDSDQAIEIVESIIQKAVTDKNLKAFSKSKLQQFLTIVEKQNDYDKFNMSKEDANNVKSNFDTNYNDLMNNLKENGKIDKPEEKVKFNSTLFIGSGNYIRGFNCNLNYGGMNFSFNNTINSINQRLTIEKLDKSNAVDIASLDESSKEEITNQITENVYSILMNKIGLDIFSSFYSDGSDFSVSP